MSTKSSKKTGLYPPVSAAYPQFILPFGAPHGARAAWRLLVSEETRKPLPSHDFSIPALTNAWPTIQGDPWPLSQTHCLTYVDLDPHIDTLTRTGDHGHLLLSLLVAAYAQSLSHGSGTRQQGFFTPVGSIWAFGSLPETHQDASHNANTLTSCFQRFLDFSEVDISDRRHLFFAPLSLKDEMHEAFQTANIPYNLGEHMFVDEDSLEPIFLREDGPILQVVYVPEDATPALVQAFRTIWERCHIRANMAVATLTSGHSIRDRYTIKTNIGAGGFAVVYSAHDESVGRDVAIKVIDLDRAPQGDEFRAFLKRFEREARLAARVKHPCIVEVYDYGLTEDEVPFMVMELLEGRDLEQHLRTHGPVPASHALPILIPALEGLGYAHEQGIVHKDLKPSNIFVKYPGERREQLCILDFGVARARMTRSDRLTQTSHVYGTPHYMAPEYSTQQIATPALDVYQMALILVETLTGSPVVKHPDPLAAMFQHVQGRLEIPQALLESPLGPILQRALSIDHQQRYQNGFELADALKEINADEIPYISPQSSLVMLSESGAGGVVETPRVGISTTPPTSSPLEDLAHAPTDALPVLRTEPNVPEPLEEKEAEDEPIFRYTSRAPYVAALLTTIGAVIGLSLYILTEEDPVVPPPPEEVITDYDRALAKVRARAAELPDMLARGDVREVIDEAKRLDEAEAKLNFEEVARVQKIVAQARKELPQRTALDRARQLMFKNQCSRAFQEMEKIPRDSLFYKHPLRASLTHKCVDQLRMNASRLLDQKRYAEALTTVNQALRYDPTSNELRTLQRIVETSRTQALELEAREQPDMGAEMAQ